MTTAAEAAARAKRNKRNGAKWEIELVKGLRSVGLDAERLRLNGREDEGDIIVKTDDLLPLVIEAKSGAFQPGPFITEAEAERANYANHRGIPLNEVESAVIVKRRGQSWRKAFVLTTVEDYFGLEDET